MLNKNRSRRSFVKLTATAAIALPSLVALKPALAAEPVKLSEDDPTAKALGYKEVSAEVDGDSYPTHKSEQICSGCVLYQGDDPEWGGCGAFPGKQVAGPGWCAAYAPKAA